MSFGANEISQSISNISIQGEEILNIAKKLEDNLSYLSNKYDDVTKSFESLENSLKRLKI
jgi:hypothetical protein